MAEPSLQTAMATLGNDGIPDKIIINSGLMNPAGTITPIPFLNATDPLEVVGAGVAKTRITSSTGGNLFVLNLASPNFNRKVTMRDLTLIAPPRNSASVSILQTQDDGFERVNFESQDTFAGAGGAKAAYVIGGGTFLDVNIFGSNGAASARPSKPGSPRHQIRLISLARP